MSIDKQKKNNVHGCVRPPKAIKTDWNLSEEDPPTKKIGKTDHTKTRTKKIKIRPQQPIDYNTDSVKFVTAQPDIK
ncbi:MAG: hypothetical protein AAGB31_06185 [Bdellovibrio sp.]